LTTAFRPGRCLVVSDTRTAASASPAVGRAAHLAFGRLRRLSPRREPCADHDLGLPQQRPHLVHRIMLAALSPGARASRLLAPEAPLAALLARAF
jgi:hypothetical protein